MYWRSAPWLYASTTVGLLPASFEVSLGIASEDDKLDRTKFVRAASRRPTLDCIVPSAVIFISLSSYIVPRAKGTVHVSTNPKMQPDIGNNMRCRARGQRSAVVWVVEEAGRGASFFLLRSSCSIFSRGRRRTVKKILDATGFQGTSPRDDLISLKVFDYYRLKKTKMVSFSCLFTEKRLYDVNCDIFVLCPECVRLKKRR